MSNTSHTAPPLVARTVTAGLLALVGLTPGCGESALGPTRSPSLAPPVVRTLSESVGSTGGGAQVMIEGTGFLDIEGGAVVIFGGVRSSKVSFMGTTTIFVTVPAHAAGLVDVVVSNPDGKSASLADAYTYVSPDSFDSNGEWEGTSQADHFVVRFRFTIQNSRLTAVSCGTSETVSVSPAPPVNNGEFSFSRDGVAIAGRLVAPRDAIGTINLARCPNTEWSARKQP